MSGWIKLHRKFTSWEWFDDSNMVHFFLYLLLSANHKDGSWHGINVKRGQLIFGRKKASEATGISERSIRTCLDKLKNTGEVTSKATNRYSILTICKYEDYQALGSETDQPSVQQTTSNRPQTRMIRSKEEYLSEFFKDFPTWNNKKFTDALDLWKAYRIENKWGWYKPIGFKSFMTKLNNISGGDYNTAVQILTESMSNNYQGIFPLKHNGSVGGKFAPPEPQKPYMDFTKNQYK